MKSAARDAAAAAVRRYSGFIPVDTSAPPPPPRPTARPVGNSLLDQVFLSHLAGVGRGVGEHNGVQPCLCGQHVDCGFVHHNQVSRWQLDIVRLPQSEACMWQHPQCRRIVEEL